MNLQTQRETTELFFATKFHYNLHYVKFVF